MKPVLLIVSLGLLLTACKKKSDDKPVVNGPANTYTGLKTITARKAFSYVSAGSYVYDTALVTYSVVYDGKNIKEIIPNVHADFFGNYSFSYLNGDVVSGTCTYPVSSQHSQSAVVTQAFKYNASHMVDSVVWSYNDTSGGIAKYAFRYSNGNLEQMRIGTYLANQVEWNDANIITYSVNNGNITQAIVPFYSSNPFQCAINQSENCFSFSLPIWVVLRNVIETNDDCFLLPLCMNRNLVDSFNMGTSLYAGRCYQYELSGGKVTRLIEFQKAGRNHPDTIWFGYQ